MITEPDVAFTDYALTFECATFAYLVYKQADPQNRLRHWVALFFSSVSLASLIGGTVHGFFLDESTLGYRILWPATLISIGLTAFAAWNIGTRLLFSGKTERMIVLASSVVLAIYSVAVIFVNQMFLMAIVYYLPATLLLFVALLILYQRKQAREILFGIVGLTLTFIAPIIQQGKISIHPVYFNHNAFYHLIQGIALFMIFLSTRWIAGPQLEEVRS